jgi:hypothetical protein
MAIVNYDQKLLELDDKRKNLEEKVTALQKEVKVVEKAKAELKGVYELQVKNLEDQNAILRNIAEAKSMEGLKDKAWAE